MFGGLLLEMAVWKALGDYLYGSGWVTATTQAGIASAGTAESFLEASPLMRTRYAHQVNVLALSKLQHDEYLKGAARATTKDKREEDWNHEESNLPVLRYHPENGTPGPIFMKKTELQKFTSCGGVTLH